MPEPASRGQRYLPGLDGLRALAVLAVIAYHLQLGWAPGGMLGVAVFFTLSGYLITDLLLERWATTGSLQLADFWRRRARRLLPALFLMLAVVTVWVSLADPGQLAQMRGGVAAAAGYVSNWWLIAQHSSYFARFGPPMPLGHLWSLAVEEQFYLIWPWLLWLGLARLKWPGGRWSPWLLAAATLTLAGASAAAMALLYHPGYDPTRVYDGTDTRAFGVLIGAALAFVWPSNRPRHVTGAAARRVLDGTGIAGLAVIACLIWRMGEYSPALYPGGMALVSLATVAVICAVASPVSRIGPLLGWRPLRWLGVRSYGIYLWHFPIIVLTTPANGQESLVRGACQVAVSIAAATLSWRFVEDPIRHGALGRWWAQLTAGGWRSLPRRAWAGAGATAGAVALAAAALAGAMQPAAALPAVGAPYAGPSRLTGSATGRDPAGQAAGGGARTRARLGAPGPVAAPSRLRTSCRAVAHIGDSTSEGMISRDYLPDRAQRLAAQYNRVGVRTVRFEISGARSIVEIYEGRPNAWMVAQQLIRHGYHGCWVLALGTNDVANVAVGSPTSLATRIRSMMSVTRGQPVMWVNLKSLLGSGPYAEANMLRWNQALLQACPRYPNMRVYNWAAAVRPGWFISDGIHYTSAGYAARARLIASALAHAFPGPDRPGSGPAPPAAGQRAHVGCLVH